MTLTQIAAITKRGIIAIVALIFLSIIGAVGYRIWYDYYIATLPPVEEKPDLKFGGLPKIIFPEAVVSSANYSYSIDTETGSFPQMPKIIKVYFIPRASIVSLLAPDESQKLAASFGFNLPREIINPTNYKYADESNGSFIIDLTTGNFSYQKNIATSSATLNKTFSSQSQLTEDFKEFLKSKGKLNDDLTTGRTNVLYNQPISATATSAEISIWPNDFEGLEIVTPSFSSGLVRGNALDTESTDRYSEVNYVYWQIDKTSFATYYLKPVESAFAELQSGLGYVSIESPAPKVSITKVALAYFESEEYAPYLQPVYVFEGPSFKALVPAISQN